MITSQGVVGAYATGWDFCRLLQANTVMKGVLARPDHGDVRTRPNRRTSSRTRASAPLSGRTGGVEIDTRVSSVSGAEQLLPQLPYVL